jgi:hypothetical protein
MKQYCVRVQLKECKGMTGLEINSKSEQRSARTRKEGMTLNGKGQ